MSTNFNEELGKIQELKVSGKITQGEYDRMITDVTGRVLHTLLMQPSLEGGEKELKLDYAMLIFKMELDKLGIPFNGTSLKFAKTAVCAHPQCPVEILREVFDRSDGDTYIIEPILSNPNCPNDIIEDARRLNDNELNYILDKREGGSCQPPTEEELAEEEKYTQIKNNMLQELKEILENKGEQAMILAFEKVVADELKNIYGDEKINNYEQEHADMIVSMLYSLGEGFEFILRHYSKHENENVKAAVARHKMCPQDILLELAQDDVLFVRNSAIESLCRLIAEKTLTVKVIHDDDIVVRHS